MIDYTYPKTCSQCGTDDRVGVFHGKLMCADCGLNQIVARRAEAAKERLESAADVTESYRGMMYLDGYHENGYFETAADAIEHLDYHDVEKDGPAPEWAFATTCEVRTLDIDEAIERLCEEGYPDMGDHLGSAKELKEAAAKWSKENEGALTVYHPDFTRKIHLERAAARV